MMSRTAQGTRAEEHLAACLARMARGVAIREALMMSQGQATPYPQVLLDAAGLFERLGIGYALIGGVAAVYFGRARFTEDLDFVAVSGHRDLLARHPEVMREFHFDPGCTSKLYHESGIEIDIWKDRYLEIQKRL